MAYRDRSLVPCKNQQEKMPKPSHFSCIRSGNSPEKPNQFEKQELPKREQESNLDFPPNQNLIHVLGHGNDHQEERLLPRLEIGCPNSRKRLVVEKCFNWYRKFSPN